MRKFLITALILLAIVLGAYYSVFDAGLYLRLPGEVTAAFAAEGTALMARTGDSWETLSIRGVELTASLPGHHATDYAPTQADYRRWMEEILDMGANAVYAPLTMDDDFYNALWAINQTRRLYLVQGVSASDEMNARTENAFDSGLMNALIQNGKTLVDALHGRRDIASGGVMGSGHYRRDVSAWVIGYLVGIGWQSDTLAYTDHSASFSADYEGEYFSTAPDASPSEAMVARVMDEIMRYEAEKYHALRPIGMMSDPETDFLRYGEVYARQLGKYAFLDPTHIQPTDAMPAGQIVGYTLFNYCDELERCLAPDQKETLAPLLRAMNAGEPYGGRLSLLPGYWQMPALAFYSASSARGTVDGVRLTEREQGERLAQIDAVLQRDGWSGGVIASWQDGWTRRSWNTAYATETAQSRLWYDVQTSAKNTGLMAFEPGERAVCIIDGDRSEWSEKDLVLAGDYPLYVRQDAEGLYLLIENATRETPVYVPLDVSPLLGSNACAEPTLQFQRAAEFLLIVDGQNDTRLLVQERYDPVHQNFLYEITGEDPFVDIPDRDSPVFSILTMPIENMTLADTLGLEAQALSRLHTWETGALVHGCGNPDAEDYNALADFCFGVGFVEIRIPWLMLNFCDPAGNRIHQDYYERYGVESQRIREIYLGAGAEGVIPMARYRLSGWNETLAFRERLKESYDVLRALWTNVE